MNRYLFLFIISCGFILTCLGQKNIDSVAIQYATDYIKSEKLKEKLSVIAGAEMEGRETATLGQRKAANYIEEKFKQAGLKPGNANSYQMKFPVYRDLVSDISFRVNKKRFEVDKDFAFLHMNMEQGKWKYKKAVFVGYGIVDSSRNIDDYKNLEVENKLVIALDGEPDSVISGQSFISRKIPNALKKGAVGIFIVTNDFPKAKVNYLGNMYRTPKKTTNLNEETSDFSALTISSSTASAILGEKDSIDFEHLALKPKGVYKNTIRFTAKKSILNIESSNVIGLLPGSVYSDEYVFITGHYDHLGKRGSTIYYGADDDGSGTTTVIQLAEAFSKAAKDGHPPKRNMVFMTVSGEEKGLWGSKYYTEHPIYSLKKTSVDLNIDMVGRTSPDFKGDTSNYIYTIGEGKISSDLQTITDSINKTYCNMTLDRTFNDPNDPNRFYYRSDHYNFAANGIPVIFYFNGTHPDYHRPSDTVDKINFNLMEKRAKLVFLTAWNIANRENMLKRDIPLDMLLKR